MAANYHVIVYLWSKHSTQELGSLGFICRLTVTHSLLLVVWQHPSKKKKKEKKTKQQGKQLVRWRPFGKGIRPNVANLTNDAITSSAIETAAKQLKSWRSIVKDHKSLVLFFLTSIPIHRMANQTTPRQLIKLGNIKTRQADQCHLHQSEKGGGDA